jgi:peptidylprolyl isomerase
MFLLFFPYLLLSQTDTKTSIRLLQDRRSEGSAELYAFLRSPNTQEREAALLAVANNMDTAAYDHVLSLLNDSAASVRRMAAFTLGMIGTPSTASVLLQRIDSESSMPCIDELLNAVGMCGSSNDLDAMTAGADRYPVSWKPMIARSIARFANRRITGAAGTRYVAELLYDSASVRDAVYAMMRINDTLMIDGNRERLLALTDDPSPEIRMWTAVMLKVINTDAALITLISLAERDQDWRVRVNAIGSLRSKRASRDRVLRLIADPNEHVALAAAGAYDAITLRDEALTDSVEIFTLIRSESVMTIVREQLKSVVARRLGERAFPLIGHWNAENPVAAAQRVRSYGNTGSKNAIPVLQEVLIQSTNSFVTIVGIESYQSIVRRQSDSEKVAFFVHLAALLDTHDPGISYTVATAFQDTMFSSTVRRRFLPQLNAAYRAMNASRDLEPMVELLKVFRMLPDSNSLPAVEKGLGEPAGVIRSEAEKAYSAITGRRSSGEPHGMENDYAPFYTPDDLKKIQLYNGAHVRTSKGLITIRFAQEAAPFTVLNFIMLAQKRFYDGLLFHRVVGNFVIQGGDPLGNGSGGPNYAIRTEVHPGYRYTTGAVGMASSGRDTEGSQWFITHCPTPHLDFRYTIFGYTNDRSVVDRMMVGDRIESIELFR